MPPYISALNPTEYCFNTIRQGMKTKQPRTGAQLVTEIVAGMRRIRLNMRAFAKLLVKITNLYKIETVICKPYFFFHSATFQRLKISFLK